MKIIPLYENVFYRDGRGPELVNVIYNQNGKNLIGFEYYNPDDIYDEENLKHIKILDVEFYSMASEEVHGNIVWSKDKRTAAIHEINDSDLLKGLKRQHMKGKRHIQIMFYDEIFDIICSEIVFGVGKYKL